MRWLNNQFFKEEFQSFAAGESSVGLPGLAMDKRMLRPKAYTLVISGRILRTAEV